MFDRVTLPDPAWSLVCGAPLDDEPGLGALTLAGFLQEVCAAHGASEALVQHLPDQRIERWTYRDLWDQSVAVAKALVAGGLAKGERVGVLMTNRAEFLAAVFGTALAGGVAAPLSTFSTAPELEHLLALSGCSVVLLERRVLKKDFAEMLCGLEPALASAPDVALGSRRFPFLRRLAICDEDSGLGKFEGWRDFLASGCAIPNELIAARAASVVPADPGVLFFSSGSTSKPKGILSAHRGVAIQCWRMRRQQGVAPGVRYWTANGYFWSGNFSMAVGGTLAAGGTLVLQRIFDPAEALTLIEREEVDFLFAWPHQWEQLVAAPNWATADLSSLRYVDVDSPIAKHPTVHTHWIEPRHCYGNTETFTLSTAYPAGTPRSTANASHGLPLPGNRLRIVDPLTGSVVPLGERGEIAIQGPTLMLGYLGAPLDATLDAEGWFRTGDGGHVDTEGRLYWEGRLNDIIKTGGANVSPVEIDAVLQHCPGVKLVQTVGIPHETLGELVVSCIIPHLGEVLDEARVRDFAKLHLASYKLPRRVLFFGDDELQMTGSAKIRTADLRRVAARRLSSEQA